MKMKRWKADCRSRKVTGKKHFARKGWKKNNEIEKYARIDKK